MTGEPSLASAARLGHLPRRQGAARLGHLPRPQGAARLGHLPRPQGAAPSTRKAAVPRAFRPRPRKEAAP
jgi:hypothetical protein